MASTGGAGTGRGLVSGAKEDTIVSRETALEALPVTIEAT